GGGLGHKPRVMRSFESGIEEWTLDVCAQQPGAWSGGSTYLPDKGHAFFQGPRDDGRQKSGDPELGQARRDGTHRIGAGRRVAAAEAVDLEVDEAGHDGVAGLGQ